jgi:hypothetical protein
MNLKSTPKSFDLTCKKGYYPHFLNTAMNLDYVGAYPELKYYGVDYMSGDERTQFSEWYKEQKDKLFRNQEELLAYCLDDVAYYLNKQRTKNFCIYLDDNLTPQVNITSFTRHVVLNQILWFIRDIQGL